MVSMKVILLGRLMEKTLVLMLVASLEEQLDEMLVSKLERLWDLWMVALSGPSRCLCSLWAGPKGEMMDEMMDEMMEGQSVKQLEMELVLLLGYLWES